MENIILQYQKTFINIKDRLMKNDEVLAMMVFGSMVTGDLWEESDIDLMIILKNYNSEVHNIHLQENGVPVHLKLMSKETFLEIHKEVSREKFIKRVFSTSRLVFSKDSELTYIYDNGRYFADVDREKSNMAFLSQLLKHVSICKKYLYNDKIYTAALFAVYSAEDFSKLYVNSSGYRINKNVLSMTANINEEFKNYIDELFIGSKNLKQSIEKLLEYIEEDINNKIKSYTSLLLEYMQEKDSVLSSEDISNDELFKGWNINFEELLNKLWIKNLIKKDIRELKTSNNEIIFNENVYFI